MSTSPQTKTLTLGPEVNFWDGILQLAQAAMQAAHDQVSFTKKLISEDGRLEVEYSATVRIISMTKSTPHGATITRMTTPEQDLIGLLTTLSGMGGFRMYRAFMSSQGSEQYIISDGDDNMIAFAENPLAALVAAVRKIEAQQEEA